MSRIEHLSQLYDRLLIAREREIQLDSRPGWSIYTPLTALALAMSARQALVAPVTALDPHARAFDILQRFGLIVVRGQRVGFVHESLFDYVHARAFVHGGQQLIDFLLESEQTLFRRTQTRQILAFERDLERGRYLADLSAILSDGRIRPHVRETVVHWLATITDPVLDEWELVARYAACDGLPIKAGAVIFGSKPWFDLLQAQGLVNSWLASEGKDLRWALDFLGSVVLLAPHEVSKLIGDALSRRPECVRSILDFFTFMDPGSDSKSLADTLIAALGISCPEDWETAGSDWGNQYGPWIKAAPQEAARIFGAQLERWFRLNPDGHPFKRSYESGGRSLYWTTELAKAEPLAFLENFLPFMRLAMQRSRVDDSVPAEDSIWRRRFWNRTDARSVDLIDLVKGAFSEVALNAPQDAMRLLRTMAPDAYITSLHVLLETVAANPEALRDLLIEQINNSGVFNAGWHCAEAHSAGRAIAAAMPWLTGHDREQIESLIFALQPEINSARRLLAWETAKLGAPRHDSRTRSYVIDHLNDSGRREWSVLRQVGAKQLSVRGGRRLAELDRKFKGRKPEEPDGIRGGLVRSPIPDERTKYMSDSAWLSAIIKFSRATRADRRWRDDGLTGGSRELSSVLKERAQEQPERFLGLLAHFPQGASQHFAWGITAGIAEAKPDADMVERVLEVVESNPAARPDERSLIWLIRACVGSLGTRAQALLMRVATGDDDSTGIGDISSNEEDESPSWKRAFTLGHNLHAKAINSARGSALQVLGDMCWRSKEAFERHSAAVGSIIGASSAAHVQWALSGLLMSALKHQGMQGIGWVLRTVRVCPAALYSDEGQQIVEWMAELDSDAFRQLIDLYAAGDDVLARGFAALAVFRRCLDAPEWLPFAERLISSDAECRSAAAAVAASNFDSARFGTTCTEWLIRFFDDENRDVRREASDCFHHMDAKSIAAHAGLLEAYVASRCFKIGPGRTSFLRQLEHAPPGLDDLVLRLLADAVSAGNGDAAHPSRFYAAQHGEAGTQALCVEC